MTKKSIPPSLKVLAGALLISFSSVYVKTAQVAPSVSGFYRVFIGGIFLLIVTMVNKNILWYDTRRFFAGICAGFVFAVDLYCWHRSIHYIGPGLATVLANFQVFFLTLTGLLFFKEKITFLQAAAIPFAFAGLIPVVGSNWNALSFDYKAGLFYGVATALVYTVYILMLRLVQMKKKGLSAASNLVVVSFSASFFLALIVLSENNSFAIHDTKSFIALLLLGVFSQGVGWLFIISGLPDVKAYLAGILLLLQPSLSFLWDVVFFSRETTLAGYFGLCLTLVAIYAGSVQESRGMRHKTMNQSSLSCKGQET